MRRPAIATNTTAASTGCGKALKTMREKEHNHKNEDCGQGGRERRARTALFVNERLRRTTANRKAAAESSEQVRRSECQIFLVSIESSAVLRGEHSANRGRFDRTEEKAGQGQW